MYLYYNMNLSEFVGGKTPCGKAGYCSIPQSGHKVIEQQQVACRRMIREA
jgi:hypothetical protein